MCSVTVPECAQPCIAACADLLRQCVYQCSGSCGLGWWATFIQRAAFVGLATLIFGAVGLRWLRRRRRRPIALIAPLRHGY